MDSSGEGSGGMSRDDERMGGAEVVAASDGIKCGSSGDGGCTEDGGSGGCSSGGGGGEGSGGEGGVWLMRIVPQSAKGSGPPSSWGCSASTGKIGKHRISSRGKRDFR